MKKILSLAMTALLLSGCGENPSGDITTNVDDGKYVVSINAEEGINVDIQKERYSPKEQVKFEVTCDGSGFEVNLKTKSEEEIEYYGNNPFTFSMPSEDVNIYITKTTFDERNIILKAPLFSDEHCERTSPINSKEQATTGIQRFINLVGEDEFDIWLSTGDRSLTGTIAADQAWLDAYNEASEDAQEKLFFCHGNHDVYWSGCASRQEHYNFFNKIGIYKDDEVDGQPEKGNRHKIVNGLEFLAIDITTYDGKINPISNETLSWAKNILDKTDKTKPVFVLSHATAKNTIFGSNDDEYDGRWGSSQDLYDLIENYPNVILFTGHTHYDGHDERNIYQGNFTAVNVPTLAGGNSIDYFYNGIQEPLYNEDSLGNRTYYNSGVVDGLNEKDMYESSQGLYVEVDKYYNTRITRFDLKHGVEMKTPWVIEAPKEDNSHLLKYSEKVRRRNDAGPILEGEAYYTQNSGRITVTFDAFTHETDMVYAYEVQVFKGKTPNEIGDLDKPNERKVIFGDWYKNYPTSNKYTYSFRQNHSGDVTVRVIGLDSFGKYSIAVADKK